MSFRQTLQGVRDYLWSGRAEKRPHRRSPRLEFDRLEDRLAPVVMGSVGTPAPIPRGTGYDGVVNLQFAPGGGCSGSLLHTGRHILTAAHCVDGNRDLVVDITSVTVQFDMPARTIWLRNIPAARIRVDPGWRTESRDLAIIELPEVAPAGAERYPIYRGSAELGQVFTTVGYGTTGNGNSGGITSDGLKRRGDNRLEDLSALRTVLGFDFDSGLPSHNRFGSSTPIAREALFCYGDSGGPVFLGGQIAGVNHWLTHYSPAPLCKFGDVGAVARVSTSAGWIDATVGGTYDLVLDMNNQPTGNNGAPDAIAVSTLGGTLRVSLNGTLLHSDQAARIRSVTIRGSGDQDTITVEAPGNNIPVTIDGRGDNDTITASSPWTNSASTPWTISGGPGQDNIVLSFVNANTPMTVFGGDGNDTLTVRATYAPVTLNGDTGDDAFRLANVTNTLGEITVPVTVNGGAAGPAGTDTLTLTNTGLADPTAYRITSSRFEVSSWTRTITNYSNLDRLVLNSGAGGDTVNIDSTTSRTAVTVNAGAGNDLINVRATSSAVSVLGEAGGDTFNLGTMDNSLGWITAPVAVNGGPVEAATTDTLNLFDQGYANPIDFKVTSASVSTPRPGLPDWVYVSSYTNLDRLVLRTGAGENRIQVFSTAASTPVTLFTGAGNDEINIGSGGPPPNASTINAILADVFVHGEAHVVNTTGDVLNVHDQSNPHDPARVYEMGAAGPDHAIRRTGPPSPVGRIVYNTVEDVHLYPSSAVNVHSTPAGTTTTVHGGPSDDVITVDDGNHTLNGIQGRLILHGGGGTDLVSLHDYSNIVAQTYKLTTETAVRSGIANIPYFSTEQLLLRAGLRADVIEVLSTPAATAVTVRAGDGDDTIKLFPAIAGALRVDGQTGVNTLDYQAYASDVTVNLPLGTATNISGGIEGIRNVIGGIGNDVLVGDHFSNVLEGGPGNDLLIGGGLNWTTGEYSFLPDVLRGGGGEDMLIAGFTIWDTIPELLDVLRLIWALPANFAERTEWLYPLMDPAWAVYSNHVVNTLDGGADDDWFFGARGRDLVTEPLSPPEDAAWVELLL